MLHTMTKIRRMALLLALSAAIAVSFCSCMNPNMLMWDDDEWSGGEIQDGERGLSNSELEIDDYDR